MTSIPGTVVGGAIVPTDTADTYPVTDPQWGLGGAQFKLTTTARNAIPVARLQKGMLVFCADTGVTYRLKNTWAGGVTTDADWEIAIGSAGAVSLIGSPNSIPYVDSSDTTLLRTSVDFTHAPLTGIVYSGIGYNASTGFLFNVYVGPSGNDSNSGISALSPWRTISHAMSQALLAAGGKYVINVADGTYPATSFDVPDSISRQMEAIGLETMIEIVGNETTPANVVFVNNSTPIVYQNSNKTVLFVRGVQFTGGGTSTCIQQSSGKIYLKNVRFDNFTRVSNSYRDSSIYTFTGANGIVITNCYTGFVGYAGLTFNNNSNITMSPTDAAQPCNLFSLYDSTFINGTGTTVTVNGIPVTGTGYMFTGQRSYINLGIFSSFEGNDIDGPFDIDGMTYVDPGDNNSIVFTAPTSIAKIKGKSYINDAGTNTWNFGPVPAAGIQLSGDGQFASPAILHSGILILNDLVDYVTYPTDQTYTRYSLDRRYTEKVSFTALGNIPQGCSGTDLGPQGVTNNAQPIYIAKSKSVITNLTVKTRVGTGVIPTDTYEIYVNGVASGLSVAISNSDSGSTNGSVALVSGDVVTVRLTTSIFSLAEDLTVQMTVMVLA